MIRAVRHRNTKQWIAEHAKELAASGMLDLIRRRSALLLATSEMAGELERFGAQSDDRITCELDTAATRQRLLSAWADAEVAKAELESRAERPIAASGH